MRVCVCEQEKQKPGAGDPWHRNHEEPNGEKKLRSRARLAANSQTISSSHHHRQPPSWPQAAAAWNKAQ